MDNTTHSQSQEFKKLAHPLSVTLCKVVIHRNYVYSKTCYCVKVCRQCSHKGLTFTCLHLCYTALVEYYSTVYLNGEVLHPKYSPGSLPHYCKCFRHYFI